MHSLAALRGFRSDMMIVATADSFWYGHKDEAWRQDKANVNPVRHAHRMPNAKERGVTRPHAPGKPLFHERVEKRSCRRGAPDIGASPQVERAA